MAQREDRHQRPLIDNSNDIDATVVATRTACHPACQTRTGPRSAPGWMESDGKAAGRMPADIDNNIEFDAIRSLRYGLHVRAVAASEAKPAMKSSPSG